MKRENNYKNMIMIMKIGFFGPWNFVLNIT